MNVEEGGHFLNHLLHNTPSRTLIQTNLCFQMHYVLEVVCMKSCYTVAYFKGQWVLVLKSDH